MNLGVPTTLVVRKTENGRNKVSLGANKGLMEWIRISANVNLASQKLESVDQGELMKHDKVDDCWIILFGIVYDVTKYLEFHPGGVEELMRVAGRDGTGLFQEYHGWVNYQNMLKSCVVGAFKGSMSSLKPANKPVLAVEITNQSEVTLKEFGLSINADDVSITINALNEGSLSLLMIQEELNLLNVTVKTANHLMTLKFPSSKLNTNRTEYTTKCTYSKCQITFADLLPFKIQGLSFSKEMIAKFIPLQIESLEEITQSLILVSLSVPKSLVLFMPLGHHVYIRVKKGSNRLHKPFTPFWPSHTSNYTDKMCFLIRIYPYGIMSPAFRNMKEGDMMEISNSMGVFDISCYEKNNFVFLAGGTGITAMINIIKYRLDNKLRNNHLFFFNRSVNEIPSLDFLPFDLEDIHFENIVSDPQSDWMGRKDKVDRIADILSDNNINHEDCNFLICGPIGFNRVAVGALKNAGISEESMFVFE